ncbi:MAG: HTH domain-containing protein [Planctomycetaceae bacterium]|nr:HTH domain-containing protein [Planctomycetaceae bacterium]
MAKKKGSPQRSDAERRARQSQRLARVLRALRCIMGPGRWDAEALARELGCSVRTVHRILQTLGEAGIPCRFDPELKAYRVPRGFKFPGLETQTVGNVADVLPAAKRLIADAERFVAALKELCDAVRNDACVPPKREP